MSRIKSLEQSSIPGMKEIGLGKEWGGVMLVCIAIGFARPSTRLHCCYCLSTQYDGHLAHHDVDQPSSTNISPQIQQSNCSHHMSLNANPPKNLRQFPRTPLNLLPRLINLSILLTPSHRGRPTTEADPELPPIRNPEFLHPK
jgi:hypothetical protein